MKEATELFSSVSSDLMLGDFHKIKDDGMFPDSNKPKNKFLQKEREMFLLSLNAVKTGY